METIIDSVVESYIVERRSIHLNRLVRSKCVAAANPVTGGRTRLVSQTQSNRSSKVLWHGVCSLPRPGSGEY